MDKDKLVAIISFLATITVLALLARYKSIFAVIGIIIFIIVIVGIICILFIGMVSLFKESFVIRYLNQKFNIYKLYSKDSNKRRNAVEYLYNNAHQSFLPHLKTAFKDEDPKVREIAVKSIGLLKDKSAIDLLILALNDVNFKASKSAEEALLKIGSVAINPLIENLNSINSDSKRLPIIKTLGQFNNDVRVLDLYINLINDTDPIIRRHVENRLPYFGSIALNRLILLYKDSQSNIKLNLLNIISKFKSEDVIAFLLDLFLKNDAFANQNRDYLLDMFENASSKFSDVTNVTLDKLLLFFRNLESSRQYRLIEILGNFKNERIFNFITDLLAEEDQYLSQYAENFIINSGHKGINKLLAALNSPNWNLRNKAISVFCTNKIWNVFNNQFQGRFDLIRITIMKLLDIFRYADYKIKIEITKALRNLINPPPLTILNFLEVSSVSPSIKYTMNLSNYLKSLNLNYDIESILKKMAEIKISDVDLMLKVLEDNYSGIVIKERKIKQPLSNKIINQNLAQIKKLLPYENSLVVFISSVMADNETSKEREIAKKTIENFAFTIAWRFEEAPAAPNLKVSYLSAVERCDIFILILKNSISKAVEMEFSMAKKSGKPILIFISKNSFNKTNIADFLKKEASDIRYKKFNSLAMLEKEIFRAIHSEIVLSYRITLPREYITYSVYLLAWFWQSEILIKSWEEALRTNSYQNFDKHLEELIDSSNDQQSVFGRISQGIERALNATGLINIIEKIVEEKVEPDSIKILDNQHDDLDSLDQHGYDFHDNHDNNSLDHHTDDTPDLPNL